MAGRSKNLIAQEVAAHIREQGGLLANWYVGIASDVNQRLFRDHNVPRDNHWYIYRKAVNDQDAREIEKYFLDQGCKGGSGGGDDSCSFVYAYLITAITRE